MKKRYMTPAVQVMKIQQQCLLLSGSGGGGHTDDPQKPRRRLAPEFDLDEFDGDNICSSNKRRKHLTY